MTARSQLFRALMLLPGLAALLLYWPARTFGLIWDDHAYLGAAADFSGWSSLGPWTLHPFFGYFRPLPLLTLGAEQLAGGFPFLSHLDQILLHALNCVLVACVADAACRRPGAALPARWPALAAGLVYAAHPALTEAAVWLSARFDLMVTGFVLAALLVDRSAAPSGQRAAGIGAMLFIALLCKEMAVGLVLVLPLWHLLFEPPERRSWPLARRLRESGNLRSYAAMLIAIAACAILRMEYLGFLRLPPLREVWSDEAGHFALVCKTLGGFLHMALLPFGATSPVHVLVQPLLMDDPEVIAGLGVLLLSPWLFLRALRGSAMAVLALCFIASLVPVLNIVAVGMQDNYLHERFMVLPLAFAAIAVALALQQPGWRRRAAAAITALWLVAAVAEARSYLPAWQDDVSIWRHAYTRDSRTAVGTNNLLESYVLARRYSDVEALARELMHRPNVQLNPFQHQIYAEALAGMDRPEEALAQVQAALDSAPPNSPGLHARAYALSGRLFLQRGDLAQARLHLESSQHYNEDYGDVQFQLSAVLEALGQHDKARVLLRKALARPGAQQRQAEWNELVSALSRP